MRLQHLLHISPGSTKCQHDEGSRDAVPYRNGGRNLLHALATDLNVVDPCRFIDGQPKATFGGVPNAC